MGTVLRGRRERKKGNLILSFWSQGPHPGAGGKRGFCKQRGRQGRKGGNG